jgi:hypothetical protein|tara:strand:- start:6 stop:569 length:564 start_codon:yes stop_codon:yes gene_type:complete
VSLFKEIKESAEGRELSTRWYRSKITALGGNSMSVDAHIEDGLATARPNYGMMNLFAYRPSAPEKLPYYDIFPLSIPVAKHRDGFTGINFHYLSIPMRVKLLEILVEAFGENNKVQMTWRQISGLRLARPIVRRYKAKWVESKFLRLPVEDMLIAALLPVQQFYSGQWNQKRPVSSNSVWSRTRNKV